jgi:type IV fimbrial biogenesis protein FimT
MLGAQKGRVLLMRASRTRGFTLIELMIGLAIAALLVMLAMPGYSVWIADAQIRNGAESIASGARYAQGQALARNSTVEFVLDPTTGTGGWTAQQIDRVTCAVVGAPLQLATFKEGANLAAFTPRGAGATKVQFSGLGIIEAPCDGSAPLTQVQITSATGIAGARDLNVLVGGGRTGIKICDPKWPNTDPKGCPP